jgi:hypothetical protein
MVVSASASNNSCYFWDDFLCLTGASIARVFLIDIFLAFRLHQTVNQDNWIHIAERIQRIINNGIEKYRCVMEESNYQGFVDGMNRTKGGAWYLKKILMDAIAYIKAENDIKVQVEKFHKEEDRAKEDGYPWSTSQRNNYYAELIKKATTAAILLQQRLHRF